MFKVNEILKATGGKLIIKGIDSFIGGISCDSRNIKPQDAFIAIKGKNFDGHNFIKEAINKGASCIVQQKQSRLKVKGSTALIEVKDTTRALGDIAKFHRERFNIPMIAVTGSNGKTSTKDMIAWVLSKKFNVLKNEGTKNNQIGLPMTLLSLSSQHNIAVLELGTNHHGEIGYLSYVCQPNIGIITNIGPSHLEYLRSLEGVFREKYQLINNLKSPYLAILNGKDRLLKRQLLKNDKRPFIISFGVEGNFDFIACDIRNLSEKIEFCVNTKHKFILNTIGYYNIYNALIAITVARIFGMEYEDIIEYIQSFNFPQSRLKIIKFKDINFIDDTYNSNPLSLRQALEALKDFRVKGRKIFVMGDMLELGRNKNMFHSQAGKQVAGICDVFIAVGELSELAAKAAVGMGFDIKNVFICNSSLEARDVLINKVSARPEDVVLVKGSRSMKMEEVFKE